MILLCQSYTPESDERRSELARCRIENEESGIFEEIRRVDGDARRWTYDDFFSLAAKEYAGRAVVVANSDISFRHPSCRSLKSCIEGHGDKTLIALTRWHDEFSPWFVGLYANNRFFGGSQDVWGFIGGRIVGVCAETLGTPGCDCILTAKAARAGLAVWNPCLSIRTMHVHREINDTQMQSVLNREYGYAEMTTDEAVGGVLLKVHTPMMISERHLRARTI